MLRCDRGEPGVGRGPHADWWAARMGDGTWASATIVISPYQHDEAVRLLGVDPETVHMAPDGVDMESFAVRRSTADERRARWLEWLVARPPGLGRATGTPGSVRYGEREVVDAFFDGPPVSRGRC